MEERKIAGILRRWVKMSASVQPDEELLRQCLAVLGTGNDEIAQDVVEIDDEELEFLAAAGDANAASLINEFSTSDGQ